MLILGLELVMNAMPKYQIGEPVVVVSVFKLVDKDDKTMLLLRETYKVHPPAYCYHDEIQLKLMSVALAKISFLQKIKNLSTNDETSTEILSRTVDVHTNEVYFTKELEKHLSVNIDTHAS